jgi:DNA (cytosine-5)-methyltransferase 1
MPLRYLSVCSGIEAASVAWHPLGFEPVAFAEIEAFPSAVLKHHYPTVPNWGDLSKFKDWPDANVDVLVGGTPCQSFSVAGLRKGLDDPRGNLALTYLALADRYRPEWVVWENVPGVLSSAGGRDFGAFLGGLAELGYGFAYRVLDARYFGLAQRRKRVFVVGHLGDWRRAAAVLFERESLSGHPAPRREAGQRTTYRTAPSLTASGRGTERAGESRGQDCVVPVLTGYSETGQGWWTEGLAGLRADPGGMPENVVASTGDISHCLNAGGMGRIDYETETLIAHSLRADGFDASEDGTGRGTPIVPIAYGLDEEQNASAELMGTLKARMEGGGFEGIVAFSAKDHGADAGDISPTLRAGGHHGSHANGGVMPAVAFDARQSDVLQYGEKSGPLDTDGHSIAVAFSENQRADIYEANVAQSLNKGGGKPGQGYPAIRSGMQVRRLTPMECERLQGFPDGYTAISYRGKPAADGPRYKALGNSMAVPCMTWIGKRIKDVDSLDVASGVTSEHWPNNQSNNLVFSVSDNRGGEP